MRNTVALNLLKKEFEALTKEMIPKEQQIAVLVAELEELKFLQNELMESIKQLGATSVEQHDVGTINPSSDGISGTNDGSNSGTGTAIS